MDHHFEWNIAKVFTRLILLTALQGQASVDDGDVVHVVRSDRRFKIERIQEYDK